MDLETAERKALEKFEAYRNFKEGLDQLKFFRDTLERVIQSLEEKKKKTERELEDEKNLLEYAPPDYPARDKQEEVVQDVELSLSTIIDELEMWKQELPRQVAIKYCIAFENFLRDFLADQVLSQPDKLASYLIKRVGMSVAIPKSPLEREYLSDRIASAIGATISKSPLEQEDIVECISVEYQAFQAIKGRVKDAYQKLLKKDPADKFKMSQSIFKEHEWEKAQADILLLFEIRHQLIHRDGKAGPKYQEKMKKYVERLNRTFVRSNKGIIPAPANLVLSPAVGSALDKSYEFEESLRSYACYITQVCG
jgi:hypothetical protein